MQTSFNSIIPFTEICSANLSADIIKINRKRRKQLSTRDKLNNNKYRVIITKKAETLCAGKRSDTIHIK